MMYKYLITQVLKFSFDVSTMHYLDDCWKDASFIFTPIQVAKQCLLFLQMPSFDPCSSMYLDMRISY